MRKKGFAEIVSTSPRRDLLTHSANSFAWKLEALEAGVQEKRIFSAVPTRRTTRRYKKWRHCIACRKKATHRLKDWFLLCWFHYNLANRMHATVETS